MLISTGFVDSSFFEENEGWIKMENKNLNCVRWSNCRWKKVKISNGSISKTKIRYEKKLNFASVGQTFDVWGK